MKEKTKRNLTREEAARILEEIAEKMRSGSVEVGSFRVTLPDKVELAVELEEQEFGLEFCWKGHGSERKPLVAILAGSPNDIQKVEKTLETLKSLGIPGELKVLSAHRTPSFVIEYVKEAERRGVKVFIACAGLANHLAGAVAAHTLRPVIGVPLDSGSLGGLDSLLSTVQMPPGVPVATVRIDGTRNAAFLAARILSLSYPRYKAKLEEALERDRTRYLEMETRKSW